MKLRWMLVVVLVLTALGCGGNRNRYIRRQAASDLTCSEGQVHLTTVSKREAQYRADGCGRSAIYTYTKGQGALRISPVEGINMAPPTTAGTPPNPGAMPPPPPPPPPPL